MFRGCTSLTIPPELPSTALADYCYCGMFMDCTSLTIPPELPSTALADYCYCGMFKGCTSLTTAPELPALTAYISCYNLMFNGCTSLTSAPALPATALDNYCYQGMFKGCTGIKIPPELPVTTLAKSCYDSMFYGCTGLTNPPELPATTLASKCYYQMFYGCTSLQVSDASTTEAFVAWRIPTSDTFTNTYAQSGMFTNCAGTRSSNDMPGESGNYYIYYTKGVAPKIVDWADGTDGEIAAMVNADRAGTINLHDYWNVGDTRTVSSTSFGNIDLVLMDKTCNGFTWTTTPASGVTKPRFIVGTKDIVTTVKIVNSTSPVKNTGGWPNKNGQYWCDYIFYPSLESEFSSIFGQFEFYVQSNASSPSSLINAIDYFAFPPNYCVLGSDSTNSGEYENALYNQWEWYTTLANRIKSDYYWTSSLQNGHDYGWCGVLTTGYQFTNQAYAYHGASPFGCI